MSPTLIPFFAGGLAANTFWMVAFPFDVIKNRMMTRPKLNPDYTTITSCLKFVLKKEGIRGFYRGFLPGLLRSFPTNASAIFVFESMTKFGKSFALE
jgi:solute carrier family 25 (mitochondrial carnitine/acylcarnitine transporter), member 20/29